MEDNLPNEAPTTTDQNGDVVETNPPVNKNAGDGGTTFPSLSGGLVANTSIAIANANLAHSCDFILDIQKDNALKRFLVAQANNIREALRAIMLELGFSDQTGVYQWLVDKLKAITRQLKFIQKNVIQPILDFEKLVVQYIAQVEQIIAYILSLPARLLAILTDCLNKLKAAIGSIFTDIAGGGSGGTGFSDVISAAKETAGTLSQTVAQTVQVATNAVAIAAVASSVPVAAAPNRKLP
jgi:hypothetical protein